MILLRSRPVEVTCTVDIERTANSLHAHAVPEGIDIQPGDVVTVHAREAPVGFGQRVSYQCSATVVRATWLGRLWTRLTAFAELTELYEVGFMPRERP